MILGTIRLPLKEFDYTLCILFFIYSYSIIQIGQSKKETMETVFKIVISLLWVLSFIFGILIYVFGDSYSNPMAECQYRTIEKVYQGYLILVGIIELFFIGMIYKILLALEKSECIVYKNLKKVLWLGLSLLLVILFVIAINFFSLSPKYLEYYILTKIIVRNVHYMYYICFLSVYFSNWSLISECFFKMGKNSNNNENLEMNKILLET